MQEEYHLAVSAPIQQSDTFTMLLKEVLDKHLHPQDSYEIAALLESMGWNDNRASKEFGVENIFELAEQMWDAIPLQISYTPFSKVEKPKKMFWVMEMTRHFLRGLIFAFPMAVSVAAMLNLKFSLWSYQYFSLEEATSIAIGTILSFIIVGGFTQAIARRGFFYMVQGYYHLARKSTFLFICIGFGVSIIFLFLIIVFNFIFNMYPMHIILLISVYFLFLTAIWLSVTVMYILRKEIIFTGLIIFGIFLVYILFVLVNMDIIISQIIALCVVSICSILLVLYFFKQSEKKNDNGISLKLPRFSIILYTVWPYFFYGFLYFTFLFVDRVNAWSTNEEFMPYDIWFRGNYEIGLDFALLTIIIPMGVSEVIVAKLMADIELSQQKFLITESNKLYKQFLKKYKRMFVFMLISAMISSYCIFKLILWYNQISIRINNENILESDITRFVLIWGVISYIILAFCLMNVVILFALSQANLVVEAMLIALVTNMLIGFLLSRWIEYEYAVFGFLVGTILLFMLTTKAVVKVFKNLDYYLYSMS